MLSPRQQELYPYLLSLLPQKEIAARLNWTEAFVKMTSHRIYEKFGVSGRLELLHQFYRQLLDSKGVVTKDTLLLKEIKEIESLTTSPPHGTLPR